MKYWEMAYYKSLNCIDCKYIKAETAELAIKKARVKQIIDLNEITEEKYLKKFEKQIKKGKVNSEVLLLGGDIILYSLTEEQEIKKQKIFEKFFELGYMDINIKINEYCHRFMVGVKRVFVAFVGKDGHNGYMFIDSDKNIVTELTEEEFFNYKITK